MVSKTAEITVRDFRSYMTECYPIIWEIIGVGGREDICSTLESLIECNITKKAEKEAGIKTIDNLSDEMKEELFGTKEI